MIDWLRGKASRRKLRLVACACCRLLPAEVLGEAGLRTLEAVEQYADGVGPRAAMHQLRGGLRARVQGPRVTLSETPALAVWYAAEGESHFAARCTAWALTRYTQRETVPRPAVCAVIHCLI